MCFDISNEMNNNLLNFMQSDDFNTLYLNNGKSLINKQ